MTNADFAAQVSREIADDLRARKLAELIRREYENEAVRQEVRRQRGAIEVFDEYFDEVRAARNQRAVESEDAHNCPRGERR